MRAGIQARACRMGAMVLVIAGCGDKGGTEPVGLEAIPVTITTVATAVSFATTGQVAIPPNCGGTPIVNCVDGVPQSPTLIELTPTGLTITEVSPGIYSFSTPVSLATVQPIRVEVPLVGVCGVDVNTARAASPTVLLTGTASFKTHGDGDEINRVDLNTEMSGLDDGDVSLSGGFGCTFAALGIGFFVDLLSSSIVDNAAHLCGAPGPPLLFTCPDEE